MRSLLLALVLAGSLPGSLTAESILAIAMRNHLEQPMPGVAICVNVVRPGPEYDTYFLQTDSDGLAAQSLTDEQLRSFLEIRYLASARGWMPALVQIDQGDFDPKQEYQARLRPEQGPFCTVTLRDPNGNPPAPGATIRVLNIVAYRHLAEARAADFSMLPATETAPGQWRMPNIKTDEDFLFHIEAPGTVDVFLSGPYSSADLRSPIAVDLPTTGSLRVSAPPNATLTYLGTRQTRFPLGLLATQSSPVALFNLPNAPTGAYELQWGTPPGMRHRFGLQPGQALAVDKTGESAP